MDGLRDLGVLGGDGRVMYHGGLVLHIENDGGNFIKVHGEMIE